MNFYRNSDESDFEGGIAGLCFLGIIIILILAALCNAADMAKELPVIRRAAERNGVSYGSPDFYLLLAIRLSEQGGPGFEFGVKAVKGTCLDVQAGWAAATIKKQHIRSGIKDVTPEFIKSLGKRYCPPKAHSLNKNWEFNVNYWFKKLQESK